MADAIAWKMEFHAARLRMPFALLLGVALTVVAGPVSAGSVLSAFSAAVNEIQDYTVILTTHETDGRHVQDRVQQYWYKKPTLAKIVVVSGPGRGGAAVWHGGDTLHGHQGGFLSFIKLTLNIHDPKARSLRGDTIDSAYFGDVLARYKGTAGSLGEAKGPAIGGVATDALSLAVSDPAANNNVSRDVLYISRITHLPVKRERFEGDKLVKSELFTDLKLNVGLTDADFEM